MKCVWDYWVQNFKAQQRKLFVGFIYVGFDALIANTILLYPALLYY